MMDRMGFDPDREYGNFRLTFEYKLAQWCETVLLLRAPRVGRPDLSGVPVQLAHDFHNKLTASVTGAVAGRKAPAKLLPPSYGVWHRAEVTLDGPRLRVMIDGETLQETTVEGHPTGYISFLQLGHPFEVRGMEIEELPGTVRWDHYRDIEGWGLRDGGTWMVRGGAIVGANGHGILYTPMGYTDCELQVAVLTHNHVNAGIFFRGSPDKAKDRGWEVQIFSPPEAVYPTGSIYGRVRSTIPFDHEGIWVQLRVVVQATRCRVWFNGMLVAEGEVPAGQGQVGLQIHLENASVEFRDLRIRSL
jgi:hypothetical protein